MVWGFFFLSEGFPGLKSCIQRPPGRLSAAFDSWKSNCGHMGLWNTNEACPRWSFSVWRKRFWTLWAAVCVCVQSFSISVANRISWGGACVQTASRLQDIFIVRVCGLDFLSVHESFLQCDRPCLQGALLLLTLPFSSSCCHFCSYISFLDFSFLILFVWFLYFLRKIFKLPLWVPDNPGCRGTEGSPAGCFCAVDETRRVKLQERNSSCLICSTLAPRMWDMVQNRRKNFRWTSEAWGLSPYLNKNLIMVLIRLESSKLLSLKIL